MRNIRPLLDGHDFPAIGRDRLDTLQLNLGYLCNLACLHCHVGAGPHRSELMDPQTMRLALSVAERFAPRTLDLTGGSPEMNPEFRWLVSQAKRRGLHVMDRLNPTILEHPGYEWAAEFLAEHRVEVIASLPCYTRDNVDAQRGDGVFDASIRALQRLNELGYGSAGSGLVLNLVYNPLGATLPPPQAELEAQYKLFLEKELSIRFNRLFTLTNMPIQRFGAILAAKGQLQDYLRLLKNAYQPTNLHSLMCRSLLSVDYRGYLYDCDFNQMLGLPIAGGSNGMHLRDLLADAPLPGRIETAGHCYGCTAGQGSSCTGALNKTMNEKIVPAQDETGEPISA